MSVWGQLLNFFTVVHDTCYCNDPFFTLFKHGKSASDILVLVAPLSKTNSVKYSKRFSHWKKLSAKPRKVSVNYHVEIHTFVTTHALKYPIAHNYVHLFVYLCAASRFCAGECGVTGPVHEEHWLPVGQRTKGWDQAQAAWAKKSVFAMEMFRTDMQYSISNAPSFSQYFLENYLGTNVHSLLCSVVSTRQWRHVHTVGDVTVL